MKTHLTTIEKLDAEFPGLADDVRKWFSQGIAVKNVPALLLEKYQVSIAECAVSYFRLHRWVPDQKLQREKRIEALVRLEVARELEFKASLAAETQGETE